MGAAEPTRGKLLRFVTAGSVDDGKSTLIGRLLHDSKGLFADQLRAVESTSRRRGFGGIDLSLVTDGLLSEREQGITIDVAYRYFATPRRKFIIGDSPGHLQYTRNMVTAASTADLAILLVDARSGIVEQTRRHAYLAHWLGVPQLVLAVNKMDLVGWDRERFEAIRDAFTTLARSLDFAGQLAIPISALEGDNVVDRGDAATWYRGPTLLEHLERVPAATAALLAPFRMPVQRVLRIAGDNAQRGSGFEGTRFRGYQGTVASGALSVGAEVVAVPGTQRARVQRLIGACGEVERAVTGDALTVELDREIDLSRGDLLAAPEQPPSSLRAVDADLCWFDAEPLDPARSYLLKQGSATVRARVDGIEHRVDIERLQPIASGRPFVMNDIGRVRLKLHKPIAVDDYRDNRTLGALILIDELSNRTVAAGTIRAS
ncbi:MAG: sulfate adenylyltransferase [Burkholderiales bacterium]|nr:MAG: sulfate adenylyltransferase [Burkholderiales bacterium]